MNRKKRIFLKLSDYFQDWTLNIVDNSKEHIGHHNFDGLDETHLKIILKSKSKINYNKLELHRKINTLLEDEFSKGLHALEISIKN